MDEVSWEQTATTCTAVAVVETAEVTKLKEELKTQKRKIRDLEMQLEKLQLESHVGVWTADTPMERQLSTRVRKLEDENEKLKLESKRAGESPGPWGR